MNKRIQIFASIVSVFIIAFAGVASYLVRQQTVPAQTVSINRGVPDLFLVSDQEGIPVGGSVLGAVTLNTTASVSSVVFDFQFDPNLLTFSQFTLTQDLAGQSNVAANQPAGRATVAIILSSPVTGLIKLGRLEFEAKAAGIAQVGFPQDTPARLTTPANAVLTLRTNGAAFVIE